MKNKRVVLMVVSLVVALGAFFFLRSKKKDSQGPIRLTESNPFPNQVLDPTLGRRGICQLNLARFRNVPDSPGLNNALSMGVACVTGDFDGNGLEDVAIVYAGWQARESKVDVLLLEQDGYQLQSLPKTITPAMFTLYPPTETAGKYGEPTTKNSGLVDWGEGDSTEVFLLQNGKFEVLTVPSENS